MFAMLTLCYDRNTHITRAILTSENGTLGSEVIESMKTKKRDWTDPVVMVSELVSKILRMLHSQIRLVQSSLDEISIQAGQSFYLEVDSNVTPTLDFLSLSKTLNKSGRLAAFLTAYFASLLQVLDKLMAFKKAIEDPQSISRTWDGTAAVEERIDLMVVVCVAFLTEAEKLEKHCNVLLQAVSTNTSFRFTPLHE